MHVVVLGAGYAGLGLTKRLESSLPSDVDLTLVDESPDHLVQHELHRVIRRPGVANEIRLSLPGALERATARVARVEAIDRDERVVSLSDGRLEYDIAAICLGARTAYYGLEGVPEHGIPLKRLSHARQIRKRAREALRADDGGRIVVGGAGLSGVQVAGELAALAREEYGSASIALLEQRARVAPEFPENFGRAVERALEDDGIEIRTGATVTGADADGVRLESGERLPFDLLVWTGGIRGADALEGERPTVEADLRLDDRTFALGDAARVVDAAGEAVPASAQAAVREARTAAENVERLVDARRNGGEAVDPDLEAFRFESPGWVVSVGDEAVATVGSRVLTGRPARALKASVGLGYLSSVGDPGSVAGFAAREFLSERFRRDR
ncbi:FAD-dependent pyridine nucleotide-disulphide oxidoreductase [Haloterrigena turkmenica DSM 5511]|uniref:FAD-dependent pyridine nucleotide-disulphide oxidoreductase n=1 Tax=Haloterrigena turkmenica (strain ATCC 51198 / DSM 5511 / JCM 9101 / NCIMB 13204 / VKM B-1734 / 4k) TaxID=543526 RepID=D2RZ52_HALTV|nr:FAD-dependent oxidoreductase [Haloterrigena turkmenica]ADB59976.1 FAD-dependent pyridine nucleotide-disulphide oxidoreductase [Haloterrigena turkmenica DSM 5511]